MARKPKPPDPGPPPAAPFHNPFGALGGLREQLPSRVVEAPALSEVERPATRQIPRAVVRFERAGRGGKAVTVVEQLGLDETTAATWLKALKSALGCGGAIEGGAIVLQGDHRERVPALLTARGVRRVTIG
jgi:translation initiation factor 1